MGVVAGVGSVGGPCVVRWASRRTGTRPTHPHGAAVVWPRGARAGRVVGEVWGWGEINSVLAYFADFADKDIDYLIRLCTPINVSSNTIRCVWSGAILFCPSPRSFSYALHRFF